jgi:DNA-directed RNA polymerase subunit beta'
MSDRANSLERINDCAAVRISLASPEDILRWSCGEVKTAETINYRTLRPEKDGLFCQRIFGPEKDHECACGKYRGLRFKGLTCDRCGVLVAHARVRRKRMGHIELAAPVVHLWFFRNLPSRLALLLGVRAGALERLVYYQNHVVLDPGETPLTPGQILSEGDYHEARQAHGKVFRAGTGAEAIEELLRGLDLATLATSIRADLATASATRREDLITRLQVVEALLYSGNQPEWMVLRRLPVIPPDLRPVVQMPGGALACSDLNDLYRRVVARSTRLRRLMTLDAPQVILRSEKRMLQQAVDALFDNDRCSQPVLGATRRPLKSLADAVKGKQGRFRENLLGKRVDYSARSVIVVGPGLKLHQCGLPRRIALELFQPFVIRQLREWEQAVSLKRARALIHEQGEVVWAALEEVMRGRHVLLNRAPTLHRMGIQAFEPVLVEGNAIRLHPMVCKAFNADFDGDQMAVHLPLSVEAAVEAAVLMTPAANVLSPASGRPIITPTQDIVLGCYYLTCALRFLILDLRLTAFATPAEVLHALEQGKIGLHTPIQIRLSGRREVISENNQSQIANPKSKILTTVGRVVFNDVLPAGMPFYNLAMNTASLNRVVADCHGQLGRRATVELLDQIKALGFRHVTRGGLSFSVDDLRTPESKARLIGEAEREAEKARRLYEGGDISQTEYERMLIDLWTDTRDKLTDDLMDSLAEDGRTGGAGLNPVYLMARSGARGGKEQIRQLAGMRGLITRPSGEIVPTPIKSSLREGLTVLEFFSSTHGARKGLADTALKTSEAGYLARKLADVAQNVVVTIHDCGTTRGLARQALERDGRIEQSLAEAIQGRVACREVRHPVTDEVIVPAGATIGLALSHQLAALGIDRVLVRSPLTCEASLGICRLCYGTDLSTGSLVELGTAVGIIAAQSISEPGTQLTMRTFHIGGVHTTQDITLGLPRVIELFEARAPGKKGRPAAVLAEVSGRVRLGTGTGARRGHRALFIQPLDDHGHADGREREHRLPERAGLLVESGAVVEQGQPLTEGRPLTRDLLRLCGEEAARDYLLQEVQAVYRAQGVVIDDRHVEIIIARMLSRVRVVSPGDTRLLPGAVVDRQALRETNDRLTGVLRIKEPGDSGHPEGILVPRTDLAETVRGLKAEGKRPPTAVRPQPARCVPLLQGISRAALCSDSFISAASFQETARVLADAALAGKVDRLVGLKENVIAGRLVPAGTGFPAYQEMEVCLADPHLEDDKVTR